MTVDLTFVVPTIPGRESLLSRCLYWLQNQTWAEVPVDAEVLVVEGSAGLGDKVNAAAAVAEGRYMTVHDDDDYITPDYFAEVGKLIWDARPDYVGLRILELAEGRYSATVQTVGDVASWRSVPRGPVPKGITRTDIVRKVTMGNEYTADRAWLAVVAQHIKVCEFTDQAIYVYDCWSKTSAFTGNGTGRDVGTWPFDETKVRRVVVDR